MLPHTQLPLALQVSLRALQLMHEEPPAPHWLVEVELTQLPPWQQPEQPVELLHTQLPDWQRAPPPQAGPLPQRQLPPEQRSATLGSHAGPPPQLQVPLEQVSVRPPHTPPLPQWHCMPEQVSELPDGQARPQLPQLLKSSFRFLQAIRPGQQVVAPEQAPLSTRPSQLSSMPLQTSVAPG